MVRIRWYRLTGVLRLIVPRRLQGTSVVGIASPRPTTHVPGGPVGVCQRGGSQRRRSRLLCSVLCLAILTLRWAGTEAVVPPEGGRLLVTAERGLLTVVAEAVAIQQVFQAITSESGSPITLVNAPADHLMVTVTIERQPLAQAIPRLIQALRTSGALSYVIVHPPHHPAWVKIFFPMMTHAPGGKPLFSQELPPPAAEGNASALTPEALADLREELAAHGATTEGLDDEQLLALTRRLEQGLPVHEVAPPPD